METALELYGHCVLSNDLNRICIDEVLAFEMSLRHMHVIDVYIPPASLLNILLVSLIYFVGCSGEDPEVPITLCCIRLWAG
jgi:hypothetical protein